MSAYLYDNAVIKKFNRWTENTNVHVYGPNETRQMFQLIADTTSDKPISLPLISIVRPGGYEIINTNKRPLTYDGRTEIYNDGSSALQLNAIPIQLEYQVNVYARKYEEADAYMREIVFNLINYPKIQITIPYQQANVIHNSSIEISSTVEDTSDISERLVPDMFTRLTLSFSLVDAYLWDARIKSTLSLEPGLSIVSSENDTVTEDIGI